MMARFRLLLINEFRLVRTAWPVHMIAIIQPTVMFLLMAVIFVHPTFDMKVTRPDTDDERALVSAMEQVGSPIGLPYIKTILVDERENVDIQLISIYSRGGNALIKSPGLQLSHLYLRYIHGYHKAKTQVRPHYHLSLP